MLYKANSHCLEDRVLAFIERTAAVHKHDTRQSKLFYVKKANTTHSYFLSEAYTYGTV